MACFLHEKRKQKDYKPQTAPRLGSQHKQMQDIRKNGKSLSKHVNIILKCV